MPSALTRQLPGPGGVDQPGVTLGGREDSRERQGRAPPGVPGPPKLFLRAPPSPSPSSPTLLLLAGGGGSESCAENLEVGEKSETCNRPGPGEGRAERSGEPENIGALFPFPGRDMINRFLLI